MGLISHGSQPQVLPSADELCAAIRGHHIDAHPVLELAAEFGTLYQTARSSALQCCCPRVELVLAVDTWAAGNLPVPCGGARMHTESLGAVIDRLARLQVHAYHLLMTVADLSTDPQVHAAWYRLAELVEGYTDLNTELSRRSLRLPALGDGG
ncbi:DUF4254 domain-containing protein [Nocardia sp. NPDC004068]|uniref:DUF4254 domain-containing protein n=1 Tax=Nocardia sp. NPDC004068 TaxID=3364303 RepID=UPI0036A73948